MIAHTGIRQHFTGVTIGIVGGALTASRACLGTSGVDRRATAGLYRLTMGFGPDLQRCFASHRGLSRPSRSPAVLA
jgi:hypothetical protein